MSSSRRRFANVAAAILILTVVFIVGAAPTPAHGNLAPMVCISLADYCPTTPSTLTGQQGSFLTVYVVAQSVGSFQQFTISVKTNASVLYPVNASLAQSVMSASSGYLVGGWQCINGVGANCGSVDGPGVVTVDGYGYYPTIAPTNGILFTATYNVTGTGANTPITFPSGCSSTSVLNGICVNLNGPTATVQTASFSNLLPSGSDFTISSNSTSVTLPRGMIANFNISLTGDTGFFGTISLTARSSSYAISGWFSAPIVNLQINGTALSILNLLSLATITPGSYNATIIATAGHISHTLTVSMNILAQEAVNAIQNGDFSNGLAYWTTGTIYGVQYNGNYPIIQVTTSTGPCTPGVLQGSSFLDIWNTLGTSGYADESFTVPQAGGALAFLTWGQITSGSESATVTVAGNGIRALSDTFVPVPIVNSTGGCTGNLPEMKVYDISGLAGQTADLRFSAEAYTCCGADSLFADVMVVPKGSSGLRDFSIAANPGSLTVPRTTNGTFTVTLSSLNGFDSSVELNATVAPSSPMWPNQIPTVVFNQNPVAVGSGKSVSVNAIFVATKTTPTSSYTITIIGTTSRMQAIETVTANVPSAAMLYDILGPEAAQAGGSAVFVNNFTNVGALPSRIILVRVATDFGTFTLMDDSECPGNTPTVQLGNSLCNLPDAPLIGAGSNITLTLAFTIPRSVGAGVHMLTETVEWQYQYPYPIIWEAGSDIVAQFQLSISANPNPSPEPGSGPSSQLISTLAGQVMILVKEYGPVFLAVALVTLAATLLLIRQAQRPRNNPPLASSQRWPLGGNSVPCTHCGSAVPLTGLFCPNCGVRRTS